MSNALTISVRLHDEVQIQQRLPDAVEVVFRGEMQRLLLSSASQEPLINGTMTVSQPIPPELKTWVQRGWLVHTFVESTAEDENTTAVVAEAFPFSSIKLQPVPGTDKPLVLSRFAYLRREAGQMVLESARTAMQIVYYQQDVLQLLTAPSPASPLVQFLAACGFLVSDDDARPADEAIPPCWTFHEALFHARSQRTGYPGEEARTSFSADPEPAIRLRPAGQRIDLPVPEHRMTISLQECLNERRTRYTYESCITLTDLGYFLHRSSRITEETEAGQLRRVTPSAGSLHSLEVYPIVSRCDGLAAGVYHYHPMQHVLTHIDTLTPSAKRIVADATRLTGEHISRPQVLLVVTSRYRRVMEKYKATAYNLILKDSGAFLQTCYLVAEAMSLAVCAIGGSEANWFARVIGTNAWKESPVLMLFLGH